ncbi:unnamed protein product [Dibothriocephalus latus]|uniref:Uncharacterized protein n=1 Tax=Dibothriocephalus latus TaxID=60516 RepID=A0A3P7M0J4_DIBLA|nr:unnamed protein product [Dibothriocephalus latus]
MEAGAISIFFWGEFLKKTRREVMVAFDIMDDYKSLMSCLLDDVNGRLITKRLPLLKDYIRSMISFPKRTEMSTARDANAEILNKVFFKEKRNDIPASQQAVYSKV